MHAEMLYNQVPPSAWPAPRDRILGVGETAATISVEYPRPLFSSGSQITRARNGRQSTNRETCMRHIQTKYAGRVSAESGIKPMRQAKADLLADATEILDHAESA